MVWMGAVEKEILHTVGRFDVNACLKSIVLEPDIHTKESYVFPREGPGELDGLPKCFQRLVRGSRSRCFSTLLWTVKFCGPGGP